MFLKLIIFIDSKENYIKKVIQVKLVILINTFIMYISQLLQKSKEYEVSKCWVYIPRLSY